MRRHLRSTGIATAACALASVIGPVPVASAATSESLPLLSIEDFEYAGAFALPAGEFGDSSMNYSEGPLEYHDGSLFIVGHNHHNAIAEFEVPALVNSTSIGDLNTADDPVQPFSTVLDRPTGGNEQGSNRIGGLEFHDGQLIVNAYEYYDAPANNTDTTLVIRNADLLGSSRVDGFFALDGAAAASGWMTQIPEAWQEALGGSHLVGHSSGIPIISRATVGPSAYAIDADDVTATSVPGSPLATNRLLEFSLQDPLATDLANESGTNDMWTHLSRARFGFIVPGSGTYVTIGHSGGHNSGVGYKITQDDGNVCGGYCPFEADDNSNYYWMWDLNDLVAVGNGDVEAHTVRPYASGEFAVPFQTDDTGFNAIGGGSFDMETGTLYLSILAANDEAGTYSNPPIIAAYTFPSIAGSAEPQDGGSTTNPFATGCEDHSDSIVRLYVAAFGRSPEPDGFRYWFDEYVDGEKSLPWMAQFFSSSDEFRSRYGAPSDRAFVNQLYVNTLGRDSDAQGLDFWTERMAGGMSRGDALLMFAESTENIANTGTAQPALGAFNRGLDGPFNCGQP